MLTAPHAKNSTLKASSEIEWEGVVAEQKTLVGLFNECECELADQT